jgi:hypothetical protein
LTKGSYAEAMAANARGDQQRRRYFERRQKPAIDEAIAAYRAACALGKDADDYQRSVFANSLGSCLAERFNIGQQPDDLRNALSALEEANTLTPDASPYKKMVISNLAISAQQLYKLTKETRYVELCVGYFARAAELAAANPDELFSYLSVLGPAAHEAYRKTGKVEYLDRSLDAFERFLPDAKEPAKVLARIAELLTERYNETRRDEDIDRAIECQSEALAQPTIGAGLRDELHVDHAHFLLSRAARTGSSQADVQRADQCLAALADPRALSLRALGGLAAAWKQRYDMSKHAAHLDRAIEVGEAALEAITAGGAERVTLLGNLGTLLGQRYVMTGSEATRDRATQLAREALALRHFDTEQSVSAVQQLGVMLQDQYTAGGRLADLELAIGCFEALAAALPPQSESRIGVLSNLGNALGDRYVRRDASEDLQRALDCHHAAVESAGGGVKATALTNLGAVLSVIYDSNHELRYLHGSIEAYQQSIDTTEAGSDLLPARMDNLGAALSSRFKVTHDRKDLDRSIELHRRALELLPQPCEVRVGVLNNLAVRLQQRYELDHLPADHEQTLATFRAAVNEGLVHSRGEALKAARNWLNNSFGLRNWAEVVEAYGYFETAAAALLRIQEGRRDKEDWLRDLANVPSRAAVAFAHLADHAQAVVTLEQGSARLLAEALHTRRAHSAAANASASEQAAPPGVSFAQICRSAGAAPLVYLCTSGHGGLALIVSGSGTVRPVWIDALSSNELERVMIGTKDAPGYLQAYADWRAAPAQPALLESWRAALEKTAVWQGERVFAELLPVLSRIDEIVLIAIGTLAMLPWHASILPGAGAEGGHVIDRIGIRYAPIASALATDVPHQSSPVYFAAHNPQPSDGAPLPFGELEVTSCAARFERRQIVSGVEATTQALIAGIDACDVFHFAGHAASNLEMPLQGGLEVAGPTRLTLERLLAESHSGRLAVLSACETGVPGLRLPEEAISLSSGFLQVGFTGVIASLWPVSDLSAFFVMDRFYSLWHGEKRDPGLALRAAQRWLRDAAAAELVQQLEQRQDLLDNEHVARLHRRLRGMPSEARPFAGLAGWAPFSLWGV